MAETILTLNELGDLFYDLTIAMIGAEADVRRTWSTYGAPAFEVTENVTFYKIYDVESTMTKLREDEYLVSGSPDTWYLETSYTRTLEVKWIFYGPDSWDRARMVRDGLYFQENRNILSLRNIYVVPQFDPAKRVPELFQGLWYERMDLTVQFNELVTISREIPYIESVEIGLYDGSGRGPEENGLREDFIVTETDIIIVEEH
jgi:hypothetical protein